MAAREQEARMAAGRTGKETYLVTDKARRYVAGHRAKPGDVLPLTEEQARYALILGELEAMRSPPVKPPRRRLKPPSKAQRQERERATGKARRR